MDWSKLSFNHPRAGLSECDERKLAIRWSAGIQEKVKLKILEEHGLQLIQPSSDTGDAQGSLRVNNTEAIWWAESKEEEPLSIETITALESSEHVMWVAPVYRGEEKPNSLEGLFTVNPTRFYMKASMFTKQLEPQLEKMQTKRDEKRRTRLKERIALEIQEASLTTDRNTIQVVQMVVDILTQQKRFEYNRDITFETIPLISPTCDVFIPDDPSFTDQWGMWRINAPYGWSITCGESHIVVAVIDEGVQLDHPDLNVHQASWNATDQLPDGSPVGNHGTACAGIVAASINNGIGVAGVAGNCQVMAIATSTWADTDIADGLYFAADNGAHIISMSFGVYDSWNVWDLDLVREALEYAYTKGLVLIAASGNEDINESRFPGTDPRTICVGGTTYTEDVRKTPATDEEDWWGACYGQDLDVVAPCIKIPTTDRLGAEGYEAGDYRMDFGGTSAATPHVAGLAALILSVRPSLSNRAVRQVIEKSCDKISPTVYNYSQVAHKLNDTWNEEVGYGRINVERALTEALGVEEELRVLDPLKEIHWRRHKHAVTVIRSNRASLVPLLRQTALNRTQVGGFPIGMTFDGSHVWVTNSGSDDVSKIDVTTDTVVFTVEVGDNPRGITFDGTHIWVVTKGTNSVSRINPSNGEIVEIIPVGSNPHGITFDGTYVWVANNGDDSINKIDIARSTVVATVGLSWQARQPEELAFDGTHIWVTHRGVYSFSPNVSKINFRTNVIDATAKVGNTPYCIAFDGSHVWVANYGDDTVSKIEVSTNSVVKTISVGRRPYGVIFDGTHIWVSNHHGHNVNKIDIKTDLITRTIGIGINPTGLSFDGTHIWVANMCLWLSPPHYVSKIPALPFGAEPPSPVLDEPTP